MKSASTTVEASVIFKVSVPLPAAIKSDESKFAEIKLKVSLPSPPVKLSAFAPAVIESSPAPASMVLVPLVVFNAPVILSLPAPPVIE